MKTPLTGDERDYIESKKKCPKCGKKKKKKEKIIPKPKDDFPYGGIFIGL